MKQISLFAAIFLLLSLSISAQDTTYFDVNDDKLTSRQGYHYLEVIEAIPNSDNEFRLLAYYANGQIKEEQHFTKKKKRRLYQDTSKAWYEDGQLKKIIPYENDSMNGELLTFWPNGQLKRKDLYQSDTLVKGTCWNQEGKEVEYYPYSTMPVFPGGESELFRYLGQNIAYPQMAKDAGISGIVYASFVVSKSGAIKNARILRGIGGGCDEEVLRLVNSFPNWQPGTQDGETVDVQYNLPVRFTLRGGKKKKKKKKRN